MVTNNNQFREAAITIGMPVFNDIDFIEESIKSVLNQTFKDFVLIISDDCSTDGSADICLNYANLDDRVVYLKQPSNIGISRNMKFLLNHAKSKYFMWAGDDDLIDKQFIEKMIMALNENPSAISAFSTCSHINESGDVILQSINYNYSNPDTLTRLKNFIKNSTDYFGYGVFITDAIREVEFPIWWWPNKKTPYNNIFPTLCYYLVKGDLAFVEGNSLFFKRIKSEVKTNHLLTGKNNSVKETLAYWIRKFNLFLFTESLINKAGGFVLSFRLSHYLFYYWFFKPSVIQLRLVFFSLYRNYLQKKHYGE